MCTLYIWVILQNHLMLSIKYPGVQPHYTFVKLNLFHSNIWVLTKMKVLFHDSSSTNWGGVTHICISKLAIVGSDCRLVGAKSLSVPCWSIVYWTHGNKHQWNLNRNVYIFIKEMHLKWSSGNWRPFSFGLNMLNYWWFRINMFSLISEGFQNGLPLRARWLYCTCWSNKHEITLHRLL